jgi:hypothetical protein
MQPAREITSNRYVMRSNGKGASSVELSLGLAKPIQTWNLPEELLCDHSSYFRVVFQGEFKEGLVKKSALDEDLYTEKAVAHLINWIYTGKLECREEHNRKQPSSTHDCTWYSLYVLADMLDMFWLAKATVSRIRRCLEEGEWLPNQDEIYFVYKNTLEKSLLRELVVTQLVDAYVDKPEKGFAEDIQHWTDASACHPTFHCDVMKEVKHHTDLIDCDRPVACRFHFYQKPGRKRRTIR